MSRSLQRQLGFSLGILLTILWASAASLTAIQARSAIEEVFDSALQETAQRILPLAIVDILGRDEEGVTQRLVEIRDHEEFLTYIVRDDQEHILLHSHDADPGVFLPWDGMGFRQSSTHRFYNEDALQGSIRLTIAEPLSRRQSVAREIQTGFGLPLLIFLPVAILSIVLAVRFSLAPLRRFRDRLAVRGVSDLSLVPADRLPNEISPVADTLNGLLGQLAVAFEAERSFTANAAHELRTPLAGAIAQAQRLQAETNDAEAQRRAASIELTLKRLTRLSERLMQLSRAEGGRLCLEDAADLRPVARILTEDLSRIMGMGRICLILPATPVISELDPDIFAILYRNLVENALRHGAEGAPVDVSISESGLLTVANDGPVVPDRVLIRLTERFERAANPSWGAGLGLAIVNTIALRIGTTLVLRSPRTDQNSGFEACLALPVVQGK
ncbi:histidine kinase dimerization/phospho-acceptor domain-containing protein [Entomohabitans teleogrylli]|uniref:histidine kinase dimerization/phospho-acceptor domain-containing protein n=1 Tax=Entomohabitans teleogrylli TaxID=1384589 RepID=UPI00073D87F7|nr:histidine kinase dimerization/phospho-acceptor domain-containing protein [Entomohabitans teleogrylli]